MGQVAKISVTVMRETNHRVQVRHDVLGQILIVVVVDLHKHVVMVL
jgi:hypothetical protein